MMDPIEIIVTSADSLSSTPSGISNHLSVNSVATKDGRKFEFETNANPLNRHISKPITNITAAITSPTITTTNSNDRWNSTKQRINDNNNEYNDVILNSRSKKPLLSISLPKSQSSTALQTQKKDKPTSSHKFEDLTGKQTF